MVRLRYYFYSMKIIRPTQLLPGDTVGVIAPASPPHDKTAIDRAIAQFERHGFRIKLGKSVRNRSGFLAGSDSERLRDLHAMFSDTSVKGIISLRGGYGATRLL